VTGTVDLAAVDRAAVDLAAVDLPAMDVAGRLARLRPLVEGAGADSLLVTALANIRYLTGFTGSAALLLVSADATLLVTDGRYRTQAAEQLAAAGLDRAVGLVVGGAAAQRDAVVGAAAVAGGTVGLEADDVSWGSQRRWAEVLAAHELVATAGVVEALRLVKDEGEVARMARAAGVAAVAAGVVSGDIDKVCRDRIARSGFAHAFEHGTGHGVGLDIHEAPAVAQGSTAILTPGVVVTVEPGIYLAGVGGVRIEDTVVVTDHGCRPLTGFTKDIAA